MRKLFLGGGILLCTLSLIIWLPAAVFCAEIEPAEYERVLNIAKEKGVVPVTVTLDDTLTLEEIAKNPKKVRAAMTKKMKTLLAELGDHVMDAGQWNNGMGQIGLYVTPEGLALLTESTIAKKFRYDDMRFYRVQANDDDGSIEAIESLMDSQGFADVEVFFNVDEVDFDIDRQNGTIFRAGEKLKDQITGKMESLKRETFSKGIYSLDDSVPLAAGHKPSFRARIDREAFYGLKESSHVRRIHPLDFVDPRPAYWGPDVLDEARAAGSAVVFITLRGGVFFSPKTGAMSEKAAERQGAAMLRAFDDILKNAGVSLASSSLTYNLPRLGFCHGELPYDVLARLYDNADPRILNVKLNKIVAEMALTNSAPNLMNMTPYWNAGYNAAGQFIMVVDSGIRKDHSFFSVNGSSKVAIELCFGTDDPQNFVTSMCPQKNSKGDSPLGLLGSGEPFSAAVCQNFKPGDFSCTHGTHVAGIAASSDGSYKGVAPGASLISAKVFSIKDLTPYDKAVAYNEDIIGALKALLSATSPGTNNPAVVNMSLGGGRFNGTCDAENPEMTRTIHDLIDRGVPVIIATGNEEFRDGIGFPACVSRTTKVASVENDASGTTVSDFSNLANPSDFNGQFFLAPGGGGATGVWSASNKTPTTIQRLSGTSMAAPHVAGLYAAIKATFPGMTVGDVTDLIANYATIPVTFDFGGSIGVRTYRRVRMP